MTTKEEAFDKSMFYLVKNDVKLDKYIMKALKIAQEYDTGLKEAHIKHTKQYAELLKKQTKVE